MNFDEYQQLARRTSGFTDDNSIRENILMAALGLSGEIGELNDLIKKALYHQHPFDRAKLKSELGDILWYLSEMCYALHFGFDSVAEDNIDKLEKRYPRGFRSEDSINRKD